MFPKCNNFDDSKCNTNETQSKFWIIGSAESGPGFLFKWPKKLYKSRGAGRTKEPVRGAICVGILATDKHAMKIRVLR